MVAAQQFGLAATSSPCTIRPTSSAAASPPTTPWRKCWRTIRALVTGNYQALLQSTATVLRGAIAGGVSAPYANCAPTWRPASPTAPSPPPASSPPPTRPMSRSRPTACRSARPDQCRARRPGQSELLIASRFPYLTASSEPTCWPAPAAGRRPLDDGSGWARLNLFAAAGGYGAFNSQVTRDDERRLGRLQRHRLVEQQHQRPGRPHQARHRHPGAGRQQHLHRRHDRRPAARWRSAAR